MRRRLLALMLDCWRFEVIDAVDCATALAICRGREVDFVLCDWAMPGMAARALCRAIRALPLGTYVYVIALTAPGDRDAAAAGLEAGADDVLANPPDLGELQARLRAGERILAMQEDLVDKSRRLTEAVDELGALREAAARDLDAVARLQRALVPPARSSCGAVGIDALWRPAGRVSGDLVGVRPLSRTRLAAYAVDVGGGGTAAALTAARLAQILAPGNPDQSPAFRRLANGAEVPSDPAALAAALDRRLRDEGGPGAALLFADIDAATGLVRFALAGHRAPAVVHRDGMVEFPGRAGPSLGVAADAVWETEMAQLDAGARLVILSGGIARETDGRGASGSKSTLAELLSATRHLAGAAQAEALLAARSVSAGTPPAPEDASVLILTMP